MSSLYLILKAGCLVTYASSGINLFFDYFQLVRTHKSEAKEIEPCFKK